MALTRPASRCRALSLFGIGGSLLGSLVLTAAMAGEAEAQLEGVPSLTYYLELRNLFYDGNYRDAYASFRAEWMGAVKAGQMRWIDSICYATMMGECCYQMGDLPGALDNYTAALNLYLNFPNWLLQVNFMPIQLAAGPSQTPWGMSTRGAQLGRYPLKTSMLQGNVGGPMITIQNGGLMGQAMMYPVNVQEIVRCTALAIRRRAELLGPLSRHDALTRNLLAALQQPICQRNNWSQAYGDVELAMALAATGRDAQAAVVLRRCQVAQGQFDHPLTATALLELGKIALRQGNNAVAAKAFLEATYAAYHYDDLGVAEEAFRYASLACLLANKRGVLPPLAPAAQWAQVKHFRQLRVSLLLSAAEGMLSAGQTPQAMAALNDAVATIAKRSMGIGAIGARLNYLRAVAEFQFHRPDRGDLALAEAMRYMRRGSHWLFQIAQVDGAVMSRAVTPRTALDLYQNVLRDPQPADWAWHPLESLSVLATPHPQGFEHWFLASLQRADREAAIGTALEVSDRARRHRFFSTLVLGGRLQALRWLLEAPATALDKKTSVQRQDLLTDFPAYQGLQQQAREVRARLAKLPLAPQDPDAARQQSSLFAELGKLSVQEEAILREMAVRREPANLLFPPLRPTEELQKAIPKGTAILGFFAAGNKLHGMLLNRDKSTIWVVRRAHSLDREIQTLLRQMGNYKANSEVSLKDMADTQWRQTARQILEILLEGSPADFTKKFPELVIVPEGILWYLPFEALEVNVDNRLQPLLARFRIRYAPTLSLAVPDGRVPRAMPKTALVLGRLYPREKGEGVEAPYKEILRAVPDAVVFRGPPLPANSARLKTQIGQLIVLDDLASADRGPYSWTPISVERGKSGNTLSDWLTLPWGGPDVVVLPGFHTPAEYSLRGVPRGAAGADVFLSLCGLMASGTRTVVLSRWRTGGQSAVDLASEFVQELPHTTPADAWQRAVMVVAETPLNLDAEPRIKKAVGANPPKGQNPFFWAGYLLADLGAGPEASEAVAAKPPKATEPGKGEAKKAPEGEPKKAAEAKPPEAQPPPQSVPDATPSKPSSGKRRGKAAAKKGKAS